ncbi:aquaporin family protein [Malacoplasma penetrans]|nr:aquaporin family protein [Malacoplasma penetrans]
MGLLSELVGTAVLILLGNGVCASVSYKRMNANQSGKWILISFAWGLAVFAGAMVSIAMGGDGWLNPVVSIMQAIIASKNPGGLYATGILATGSVAAGIAATFFISVIFQMLGAMLGQSVLNFINYKFIKDRENPLDVIRGAHSTGAAYKNKEDKATIFNLSYEFVGTLVLTGMILVFGSNKSGIPSVNIGPLFVMLIITSIGMSLGSATGFSLNPARDLGPRIVFAGLVNFLRKEDKVAGICDWGYSWVPVVAPMAAGVVMGCFGLI